MNVQDVMKTVPVVIQPDRPIRDVVRMIYNLGISAVLVVDGKKLVGIVTEEDILHRLFPSVREVMEDAVHARSASFMEKRLPELVSRPVSAIMTKDPITITAKTPLMTAQSKMLLNKFSHLPVVDSSGKLVGIISQGDIFKTLIGVEIPFDTEEEYHDWLSRHLDLVAIGKGRYTTAAKSLKTIFDTYGILSILDIGCGTGGHDVELAGSGYQVVGIEKSREMFKKAEARKARTSTATQEMVTFKNVSYLEFLSKKKRSFDAAIFMGNALPHIAKSYKQVLKATIEALTAKHAVLIMEIVNFEKVLNVNFRLQDFNTARSSIHKSREYAFVEYYDPPREKGGNLMLNMAVLYFNGKRWSPASINSTPIAPLGKNELKELLKSYGFKQVEVYGASHGDPLFKEPFDKSKHDWMNIVAVR